MNVKDDLATSIDRRSIIEEELTIVKNKTWEISQVNCPFTSNNEIIIAKKIVLAHQSDLSKVRSCLILTK